MDFKTELKPGDIIIFMVTTNSLFGKLESLLTKWGHVAIYLSDGDIIESIGRGVIRDNLFDNYKSNKIAVMRLNSQDADLAMKAAQCALKISMEQQSRYDYKAILNYAIPRLILTRLHLPIPVTWQRDSHFICSELVWEAYYCAGMNLQCTPKYQIPLPEDFLKSPVLKMIYEGSI